MARNVSDLALMLDAMAVLTQHDPLSRPVPQGGFQVALKHARPPRRIGFSADLGLRNVDPEVARISKAGVQRLTQLGCVVDEQSPDFSGAIDCFQVLRALLFADVRGGLLPHERDRINPDIVWNIEKGQQLTADEIIRARRQRHALFHRVAKFFEDYDLLACPTVAVPPLQSSSDFPLRSREKN